MPVLGRGGGSPDAETSPDEAEDSGETDTGDEYEAGDELDTTRDYDDYTDNAHHSRHHDWPLRHRSAFLLPPYLPTSFLSPNISTRANWYDRVALLLEKRQILILCQTYFEEYSIFRHF